MQNNVKIYVGNNEEPLHITKMADLIPYYPYIIGSSYHNNVDKTAVIHLAPESYVDSEEKRRLKNYLDHAIKIYRRCKRKKIEYIVDDVVGEIYWIADKEVIEEIVKRVAAFGTKATTDGLHTKIHEYYRQELAEELVKNGLNLADYGYERFVKEN